MARSPRTTVQTKAAKATAKVGRPSSFSEEIAERICSQLADGKSLRKICLADDMPHSVTVFRWLAERDEFRSQYARAREAQADALFDEALDIADDGINDWVADREEEDGFRYNGDAVQRSKLRIDTRKWMAGKLRPKVYGDKVALEHDVSNNLAELLQRIDGRTRAVVPSNGQQ